jgi:hypothetical protein
MYNMYSNYTFKKTSIFFVTILIIISLSILRPDFVFGLSGNNSSSNTVASTDQSNASNWVGSVPISSEISKLIKSEANTPFTDAVNRAINTVGENSSVSSASLKVLNGYLVYFVVISDKDDVLHNVIVDAGNGHILSNVPSFPVQPQLITNNTTKGLTNGKK